VEQLETHAAYVFLVGERAFKVKKSVKLPYLDFSRREMRHDALARELEVNRIFAPEIYLGLSEVCGEPVLVMRRFAARALLAWQVRHGGVGPSLALKLAAMAVAAHDVAPRRIVSGSAIMMGLGVQLSRAFTGAPDIFPPGETLTFHAVCEASLKACKKLLDARSAQGLVRRCHGDMHCGNIIVENDEPKLFDAIEFSEAIATVDVLYDLAFLLMDLWTQKEKRSANIILNRYLHLRRAEEDLTGLAALPLFLSMRAGVRAVVSGDLARELAPSKSMQARGQALDYFRAAIDHLKMEKPMLVCVGGLSGTGKSTAAADLAVQLGAAPGAIHIRSDIERKVLAGVEETQRLGPEHYGPEASHAVYQACLSRAGRALRAGYSVVVDAVFAKLEERRLFESCAGGIASNFLGVWLEAPASVLASRISARQADASDATVEVVARQLHYDLGPINWARINAADSPARTLAGIAALLRP
jgi:aminoglycoside phosphotransferase family enzyme/predicted kinase